MSGTTVSRCLECDRRIHRPGSGGAYFCGSLCKADYERAEARQRARELAPSEGFDDDYTDGGRRSDAAGRL
jgi:hypothetical protein